jgi:hypothetical protein
LGGLLRRPVCDTWRSIAIQRFAIVSQKSVFFRPVEAPIRVPVNNSSQGGLQRELLEAQILGELRESQDLHPLSLQAKRRVIGDFVNNKMFWFGFSVDKQ